MLREVGGEEEVGWGGMGGLGSRIAKRRTKEQEQFPAHGGGVSVC
jgi:hypothetical protein